MVSKWSIAVFADPEPISGALQKDRIFYVAIELVLPTSISVQDNNTSMYAWTHEGPMLTVFISQ